MRRSSPAPRTALAVVVGFLLAACSGTTATVVPSTRVSSAPVSAPSAVPTAAPSAGTSGTATAGAADSSGPPSPMSSEPPAASLSAEGGDAVVGQLGSFTWGDGGSDSPWLPGAALTVGVGEKLTMSIADRTGLAQWTARRVPSGTSDGSGAVALGSGTGPVTFDAPPPGTWSVQVAAGFTDDLGSATWYWLITVR